MDFDKQLCYYTCFRKMFEVTYLRRKYEKRSAVALMPSIIFLHSPLRFLAVVRKAILTELSFKMQFMKNILVYIFGVFTFSFCDSFYEGFIHKIILVSNCLLFVSVIHSKSSNFSLKLSVIHAQCPY